jgi:hypothetical protein
MRGLALARYHVLSRLRSSSGLFATAIALAALPLMTIGDVFTTATESWREIEFDLPLRAAGTHAVYFWHLLVLVCACELFGTPKQTRDGIRRADLTETAPITPAARFFGDAAGIFQCVAAIHLCALPLLALAVVLSPLPSTRFFWLEGIVLAGIIFGSAAASWKLRSTGKWMRTRTPRSVALFFILLLGVLMLNTRWKAFIEAFPNAMVQPTTLSWMQVRAAVVNMPMLIGSLAALYFGYILYYTLSSIRAIDRGEERTHAL